jgi:hypothetical protein
LSAVTQVYERLEHMGVGSDDLGDLIDRVVADVGLTGAVRVDLHGGIAVQRAYGLANRALRTPT